MFVQAGFFFLFTFFYSSSPHPEYLSASRYSKIPLLEFVWDSEWNQLKENG